MPNTSANLRYPKTQKHESHFLYLLLWTKANERIYDVEQQNKINNCDKNIEFSISIFL